MKPRLKWSKPVYPVDFIPLLLDPSFNNEIK